MKIHATLLSIILCCWSAVPGFHLCARAQHADFAWVNPVGGAGATTVSGYDYRSRTVITTPDGFVYNTGNFSGSVQFDPVSGSGMLDAANGQLFLIKYDTAGNFIWVKQFGNTTPGGEATAIAADTAGDIYIGGFFLAGTAFDLDPGPATAPAHSNGSADIFILKLDRNGDYLWGKTFGSNGYDRLNGMTADPDGNVFATGNYNSPIHFSTASQAGTLSGNGCYVLKLDPQGGFEWARSWTGEGYGIALDGSGNVITCGNFGHFNTSLRVDFNPGQGIADTFFMTSDASMDLFISKLDPAGNFVWARRIGSRFQDQSFSVAADPGGSVYITGIFCGTVDFDPGAGIHELTSGGVASNLDVDAFILKLDSGGNFCWARQTHGTGSNWGWSVTVGESWGFGVYAAGVFRGRASFRMGSDTVQFSGIGGQFISEGFLLKLDTSGNLQWARQMGSTGTHSVSVDSLGGVYTSGWFSFPVTDMDPDPDPAAVHTVFLTGAADGFVHKMRQCLPAAFIRDTSCGPYRYGGMEYRESGIYEVPGTISCDAGMTTTLDLTIYILEPEIMAEYSEIFTTLPFASYQWYKDGILLPGETRQKYLVTENGSYTVQVSNGEGCVETAPPYVVNNLSAGSAGEFPVISVFPNPAEDYLHIRCSRPVQPQILSIDGRVLISRPESMQDAITLSGLPAGVYILLLHDRASQAVSARRILKQ